MKIKSLISFVVAVCIWTASLDSHASAQTMAVDPIIINATIHTMDKTRPRAEAIAVYGNSIAAVGTSADEIRKLAGSATRIIDAAVTRRTLDGKNPQGWMPEQKITIEEAVRAYTIGSAYAGFAENKKGTLAPGKLADILILSQDIFSTNPVEIEETKVRLTIMDGRVVYEEKSRG